MSEAVREAAARLRAAGMESARLESRILWEHALKFPNAVATFNRFVERRLAHEPVAYIVGEKEFWSLPFSVGPGALIPRPETETLIEQAICEFPNRGAPLRVLDLGTGSGCLLVTFLTEYPNAKGLGVDVSADALQWAAANAARHRVSGQCAFALADWQSLESAQHDVVFANPPYILSREVNGLASDVRDYEPLSALNGGPDGLAAYRALGPVLWDNLAPEGRAFLEIGLGQHHMVAQILERQGFQVSRIVDDLADIPRCMVVRPSRKASLGTSK